mmetsp:Transcript_67536/g.206834  ORF Transcript_67536/g.206834 Transcript_67536/m.206834 type:complete len:206 (-) Transcript_67536:2607-3224(-)
MLRPLLHDVAGGGLRVAERFLERGQRLQPCAGLRFQAIQLRRATLDVCLPSVNDFAELVRILAVAKPRPIRLLQVGFRGPRRPCPARHAQIGPELRTPGRKWGRVSVGCLNGSPHGLLHEPLPGLGRVLSLVLGGCEGLFELQPLRRRGVVEANSALVTLEVEVRAQDPGLRRLRRLRNGPVLAGASARRGPEEAAEQLGLGAHQ